jgi:hypothetical protein
VAERAGVRPWPADAGTGARAAALGIGLAILVGVLALWDPVRTIGVALSAVVAAALLASMRGVAAWRAVAAFLIVGYVVLGRGFAYNRLPVGDLPLYVGELALIACLLLLPHRVMLRPYLREPVAQVLLAWMLLGAALTLVHLRAHGATAVRDAATWYYAAFAYVGYAFAARAQDWRRFLHLLGLAFVAHLFFRLVALSGAVNLAGLFPTALGSDVRLLILRPDASSVHLAGGFLFTMLLARYYGWPPGVRWALAVPHLLVVVALQVRAAYVALALLCAYLALTLRLRRVLQVGLVLLLPLAVALLLDVRVDAGRQTLAATRILEEVRTILPFSGPAAYEHGASRTSVANTGWRLEYWGWILRENTRGVRALLLGKGFGPELSPERGPEGRWTGPNRERPNRNPHSIALTVFGRMGVVGLGLWLAFHGLFFRSMLRWQAAARRAGQRWQSDLATFQTGYLILILGTALFGVLLESPFMAIPYYLLLGASLRLCSIAMRRPRSSPAALAAGLPPETSEGWPRPPSPVGAR